MSGDAAKQVLIVQSQIKRYRVPFYERLYESLRRDGIKLKIAYSDPVGREAIKCDTADLPREFGLKLKGHQLFGNRLLYQAAWRYAVASDIVILEQANKHLLNYPLLCLSALGKLKVAFWGHGRDRQSRGNSFSDWLKKRTLNRVDWWFAYTEGTAEYLVRRGFSSHRITNVHNAVDTTGFREQLTSVSDFESYEVRKGLGIAEDSKVGLFCGGITREKLPQFLVESAVKIRERLCQFHLVAIGAGPEQACFEQAAARYPWFHYLGPCFGRDKALYFALAHVFLKPTLVGLAILDAFTAGLPLITTELPSHGPEIEYLEAGKNGLMTAPDVESYVSAVAELLTDASSFARLRAGALASAKGYSTDMMAANFRQGILQCLRMDIHEPAPQSEFAEGSPCTRQP